MEAIFDTIDEMKEYKQEKCDYIKSIKQRLGFDDVEDMDLIAIYKNIAFDVYDELFAESTGKEYLILGYFFNSAQFFLGSLIRVWHTLDAHFEYPQLVSLSEIFCFYSEKLPDVWLVGKENYLEKHAEEELTRLYRKSDIRWDAPWEEDLERMKETQIKYFQEDFSQKWRMTVENLPKTNKNKIMEAKIEYKNGERIPIPKTMLNRVDGLFKQYPFLQSAVDVYNKGKKIVDGNFRKQCFVSVADCSWLKKYVDLESELEFKLKEQSEEEISGTYALKRDVNLPFLERKGTGVKAGHAIQVDLNQYRNCYYIESIRRMIEVKDVKELVDAFWENQVFMTTWFTQFVAELPTASNYSSVLNAYKLWVNKGLHRKSYLFTASDFYWKPKKNINAEDEKNKELREIRETAYEQYLLNPYNKTQLKNKKQFFLFPSGLHLKYVLENDWKHFWYEIQLVAPDIPKGYTDLLDLMISIEKNGPNTYVELSQYFWNILDIMDGANFHNPDATGISIIANNLEANCHERFITVLANAVETTEKIFFCCLYDKLGTEKLKQQIEHFLNSLIEKTDYPLCWCDDILDRCPIAIDWEKCCADFLNYALLRFSDQKIR